MREGAKIKICVNSRILEPQKAVRGEVLVRHSPCTRHREAQAAASPRTSGRGDGRSAKTDAGQRAPPRPAASRAASQPRDAASCFRSQSRAPDLTRVGGGERGKLGIKPTALFPCLHIYEPAAWGFPAYLLQLFFFFPSPKLSRAEPSFLSSFRRENKGEKACVLYFKTSGEAIKRGEKKT